MPVRRAAAAVAAAAVAVSFAVPAAAAAVAAGPAVAAAAVAVSFAVPAAAAAAGPAAPLPAVTWVSAPVHPGETILLAGAGFSDACTVLLNSSTASAAVPPLPGHTAPGTLKAAVPPTFPDGAFALTVACPTGASAPFPVNSATPWWVLGDAGRAATPGGWLRVQGIAVAWLPPEVTAARRRLRLARVAAAAAPGAGSPLVPTPGEAAVAEARAALAAAVAAAGNAAPVTTVRLTPVAGGGAAVDLPAVMANATQWSVHVPVPPSLPPGEYTVTVSNGAGCPVGAAPCDGGADAFTPLDAFISPAEPHVSTVTVTAPAVWPPPGVFVVTAPSIPAPWPFNASATSDAAVAAAVAAAAAAGGGTVLFPPGTYFLANPIVIPPNTVLAGTRPDVTGLYFAEMSVASAPFALLALNDTAASAASPAGAPWGVRDLSLFVTGFHNYVVFASNWSAGFVFDRVTVRANAYFASNGPSTSTHGRWANWTVEQPGAVLQIQANGFRVSGCDLFGSFNVISSMNHPNVGRPCDASSWPNACFGATWGLVAGALVDGGEGGGEGGGRPLPRCRMSGQQLPFTARPRPPPPRPPPVASI
jgi:hypothetical protein